MGSSSTDAESIKKKEKKEALKAEAKKLGISYDELKAQKKSQKKKREADALESKEHETEVKRLRAYSHDAADAADDGPEAKKRRTRSMDKAEEEQQQKSLSTEEWRNEHQITLKSHGSASKEFEEPYREFTDAPFGPKILEGFKRAGFERPSAIQAQAWPLAIAGKDLISIAKTGSGKTCGFLLPVFYKHKPERRAVPILLVLAPTRELSVQIQEEAQRFGRPLGIRCVCCYGGSSKYPQIAALERGVDCIIATPGRLNDLLEMKKANLSTIKYLVLDEADRMLDMVSFVVYYLILHSLNCNNAIRIAHKCTVSLLLFDALSSFERALNLKFDPSWTRFPPRINDKHFFSLPHGPRKFRDWHSIFCKILSKSMSGK